MKKGADLRGLVGYQIQRVHLELDADARAAMADHDLSPAKLTALILIRDNPGCDQTALGRALSICDFSRATNAVASSHRLPSARDAA